MLVRSRSQRFTVRSIMQLGLIAALVLSFSPKQSFAETYFIEPITTELHQRLLSSKASLYAVVNCSDSLEGGQVDLAELGLLGLLKSLREFREDGHTSIHMFIRFESFENNKDSENFLEQALENICRNAGFEEVKTSKTWTSVSWDDRFGPASKFEEPEDNSEDGVGDFYSRAFPLRTRLSRYLLGDYDCFVRIRQPIDTTTKDLSGPLRDSIKANVEGLNLPQKNRLIFDLRSTDFARDNADHLFGQIAGVSPAEVFAKELGFEQMNFRHSPGRGAPEKLLGKPLPPVQLVSNDGAAQTFDELRNGTSGLLTVWSNADQECRKLANALNKLDGVGYVIAAAISLPNERVTEIASKTKWEFSVVSILKASTDEQLQVWHNPTTFFINSEGIVVGYFVNYEPGDEEWIQEQITELLNP
ncbi:hypothetical protein AB1L42_13010 [Thalassoglobus sp. JC818]|uniref:TlpA family protein disulfide reductase n=1 Tax=Thalassoglobus sp. JC818 TaxID=3232136 RepID=UPI00345A6931